MMSCDRVPLQPPSPALPAEGGGRKTHLIGKLFLTMFQVDHGVVIGSNCATRRSIASCGFMLNRALPPVPHVPW